LADFKNIYILILMVFLIIHVEFLPHKWTQKLQT